MDLEKMMEGCKAMGGNLIFEKTRQICVLEPNTRVILSEAYVRGVTPRTAVEKKLIIEHAGRFHIKEEFPIESMRVLKNGLSIATPFGQEVQFQRVGINQFILNVIEKG